MRVDDIGVAHFDVVTERNDGSQSKVTYDIPPCIIYNYDWLDVNREYLGNDPIVLQTLERLINEIWNDDVKNKYKAHIENQMLEAQYEKAAVNQSEMDQILGLFNDDQKGHEL